MSKDTDILLVDGPSAGVVLCAPVPVRQFQYHGDLMYEATKYERDGKFYWIAAQGEITFDTVDALIDAKNFQPAWDLRNEVSA